MKTIEVSWGKTSEKLMAISEHVVESRAQLNALGSNFANIFYKGVRQQETQLQIITEMNKKP